METQQTTTLKAPEIVCGGCANSIKNALAKLAGISQTEVDIDSKIVTVKHNENATREEIIDALDRAGFEAE